VEPPPPPRFSQLIEISALAWGASRYVAVGRETPDPNSGYHGAVYTSTDGTSWKAADLLFPEWLSDVAYGNDVFVAVSSSPMGSTAYVSKDGLDWTASVIVSATTSLPVQGSSLAFGNGVFITSNPFGLVERSKDGKAWTRLPALPGVADHARGVEFGAGVFASWQDGNNGMVAISANGDAWTSVNATGTSAHWVSRLFGGPAGFAGLTAYQCCFGETGGPWYGIVQSTDGAAWSFDDGNTAVPVLEEPAACVEFSLRSVRAGKRCTVTKPVLEDRLWSPNAVLHEGPVYLVAGTAGILTSPDGTTFTRTLWKEEPEK
jgi:hypothetical protein